MSPDDGARCAAEAQLKVAQLGHPRGAAGGLAAHRADFPHAGKTPPTRLLDRRHPQLRLLDAIDT